MLTVMQNVINNGTGRRMNWEFGMTGVEIAGKTGTTNNNCDAWFMCVTPRLVAGAWVGGENQHITLNRQAEGSIMALPIVGEFLRSVHKDPNINVNRTDRFTRPEGWVEAKCEDSEEPSSVGSTTTQDEFFD